MSLAALLGEGSETDNDFYFRDEPTLIKLEQPSLETPDPLFPMAAEDLLLINNFITTGNKEEQVPHEWTKLYYHRLFDEPNSQVSYIVEKLKTGRILGETVASLWDKTVDQEQEISPCTLTVWCRIRKDALETHIHAHSSDAYKKLLMNLQEFIALHYYIARQIEVAPGSYFHFIDSCHIHEEDRREAQKLIELF